MPQIPREVLDTLKNSGVRGVASATGINAGTVSRALSTGKASPETIAKLAQFGTPPVEKITERVRTEEEFKGKRAVTAPRKDRGIYSWSLETIRAARDNQLIGNFKLPVQMSKAFRTDDALFTAYNNRIAPQAAVEAILVGAPGARGERARRKAQTSCIVSRNVLGGINGTLANHGLAIGYNEQAINHEGTRTDFRLTEWPLEFVRWEPGRNCLMTRVRDDVDQPIIHGDGRWTIFRKFEVEPWTQDACVLPGALLWAAHANGIRDWAAASTAHGRPGALGTLMQGAALQNATGLTPEAQALLTALQDLMSGESAAAILPAGCDAKILFNGSTAWQVFLELINNRTKAAQLIYTGTDAALGAQGGAPGVDISALFGVAITRIQGDFAAIQDGLRVGVYEPWTAINDGDSTYAPTLVYQLPDTDAQKNIEQIDARRAKFFDALDRYAKAGMTVDQEVVNCLATEYKVKPPTLAPAAQKSVKLDLAPADLAKVVTINEARASQGLPPHADPVRGAMTIPQAEEADKARTAAVANAAPATPPAPAPAPTPEPAAGA